MGNGGGTALELLLQRELGGAHASGAHAVSYDDFLARPRRSADALEEWVDGFIIPVSTAGAPHQETVEFLHALLHTFVDVRGLGVVRRAPFQAQLARTGRSPDMMFISNARLDQVKATHVIGAPDLAVEVITQASAAHDRGEKFYEYERAGVREYWLIDPDRQWAEFYVTDRRGRYQPGVVGDAGIFRSRAVRGFWLRLEWLWELPQAIHALSELDIFQA